MRTKLIPEFIIVAAIITAVAASWASAGSAAAQGCPAPDLTVSAPNVFWASYADYRSRRLTVNVSLANGGGDGHSVTLERESTSGGARLMTSLPRMLAGTITSSESTTVSLVFLVPVGTYRFNMGLYVSAEDVCGGTHRFPAGPWPGDQVETGCPAFPEDNVWNTRIDSLPVDPNSSLYVQTIGAGDQFHADFGSGLWDGGPIGIPFIEVTQSQPEVPLTFEYADESDLGPYPIPADAPIEGGSGSTGDRHVLVIDRDACILYEVYHAYPQPDGSWHAGSGAVFDLRSNGLRPPGWTSADAAGLPIYPGLVKYDEVAAGEIRHAIRFTAPETRREFIWPARHFASDLTGIQYPPMGQRFRLKADYDISAYSPEVQVILTAMKRYGIILADNGAPWYIGGVPDERWDNDILHQMHFLTGSDFEAVDESSLMVDPDSAQAAAP